MSGILMMLILLLFFAVALIGAYGLLTLAGRALNKHMPIKSEPIQTQRLLVGNIRSRN